MRALSMPEDGSFRQPIYSNQDKGSLKTADRLPSQRKLQHSCTLQDLRAAETKKAVAHRKATSLQAPRFLIDPRRSRIIGPWDAVTALALVFTALFTPFEVAFLLSPNTPAETAFILNRLVDFVFICDIGVQFFLMQSVSDKYGDRWITDHRMLVRRYLRGWFAIDILATATSVVDILAVAGSGSVGLSQLKVLRVVRVARLTKLMRLVRASRLLTRWETKVSINYAGLSLVRIMLLIMLCTHWSACTWNLGSSFTRPTPAGTYHEAFGLCVPDDSLGVTHPDLNGFDYSYEPVQGAGTNWRCASPFAMYVAALYWAIMTITSIGYGDITPSSTNSAEQLLCLFLMLLGAMVWGQVVATFCSVISAMSREALIFRNTLDQLNHFMATEPIPRELKWRLREYFFKTKHLRNSRANVHMLRSISPQLQAEVIYESNKHWLVQVKAIPGARPRWRALTAGVNCWLPLLTHQARPRQFYRPTRALTGLCAQVVFLLRASLDMVSELVLALSPVVYAPDDLIVKSASLNIVCRGVCLFGGRVLTNGAVWGEDALLECEALRTRSVRD